MVLHVTRPAGQWNDHGSGQHAEASVCGLVSTKNHGGMMKIKMEMKRENVNCNQCGKQFTACTADIKKGAGKFCSRLCADLGRGYMGRLLRAIPGTTATIAEASGIEYETVVQVLTRMLSRGLIHVDGLEHRPITASIRHSAFVLRFAAGPATDPNAPTNQRAALSYEYDKKLLSAMPGTRKQLEERTGIDHVTVSDHLKAMAQCTPKRCHIKRWKKGKNGVPMAIYSSGPGVDAVCELVPLTNQEKYRRYMDKVDRTGRREEWRRKQSAKKRYLELRYTTGDPMLNALFGTPQERKAKAAQPNGGNNE